MRARWMFGAACLLALVYALKVWAAPLFIWYVLTHYFTGIG